jgi:hypothetical protein
LIPIPLRAFFPPLRRTSSFLEEIGGMAKKSGFPVLWQIAYDLRF